MVSLYVSLLMFSAEVNCSMLFGTEKYSGRAMNAGFCLAAWWTAVEAASRLSFKELRTFMWIRLIFKPFTLLLRRFGGSLDMGSGVRTKLENF